MYMGLRLPRSVAMTVFQMAGLELLAAVMMKIQFFWRVTSCRWLIRCNIPEDVCRLVFHVFR